MACACVSGDEKDATSSRQKPGGGGRGAVDRFHEERSDERVGATRLEDHAATEVVVRRAEALEPIGEGSAAEIGTTVDDNARRLPLGV